MAASEFILPQKCLRLGQKEVEPVLIETPVHWECKRLAVSSKSEAKLFNLLSFKPSLTPWANKAKYVKALGERGVLT